MYDVKLQRIQCSVNVIVLNFFHPQLKVLVSLLLHIVSDDNENYLQLGTNVSGVHCVCLQKSKLTPEIIIHNTVVFLLTGNNIHMYSSC